MNDGLAHHRAGHTAKAEASYAKALEIDDKNVDALHLLGVIHLQASKWDEAAPLIEAAIAENDQIPSFHDHLAVVRRNQNRLEEAVAGHRRALELDPTFASAHNNLASTLRQMGRLGDAVQAAHKALNASPSDALLAYNSGNIFLAAREFAAATDAFTKAVAADPESAAAHERLGLALFRRGQLSGAVQILGKARELSPSSLEARRWLIEVLMQMGQLEDANAEANSFVDDHPDDARVQALLGICRWRAGDIGGAEQAFKTALDLDPDHLQAVNGLSVIDASVGRTTQAEARYRRVLELDPDNVDAYGNLSLLGGDKLSLEDAENLARLLARRDLANASRATASFALAQYLRRCGQVETAFEWYRTGNALRRAHFDGLGQRFVLEHHLGFIEARERVFTSGFFRARAAFGDTSELPVFIVGMPRSGTTLVEQILAAHPKVYGAGELRDIGTLAIEHLPEIAGSKQRYPDCLTEVSPAEIGDLATAHLARLQTLADKGAQRVIDKMPFNFMHIGLIRLMFPGARIIHCQRDKRDVGLSCFTSNFTDNHPWTTDLGEIGHYIRAYERMMAHWRAVLGEDAFIELDYETLVAEPEAESRRLVKALGLRWSAKCLKFHESKRPVTTASRAQVRQPVYTRAVGRWRAFESELRPLLDVLDHDEG